MRRPRKATPRRRVAPPRPARRSLLGRLLRLLATAVAVALVALLGLFIWQVSRLPAPETLFSGAGQVSVRVLAAEGSRLAERGVAGRPFVPLDEISPFLVKAVVATEDRRFWQHTGLDPIGVLRAAFANLRAGGAVEGGSTITQQLAKNIYLTPERSLRRKLDELVLAIWLEARLTKEEILTLYLNRVYLGAGAYGVEAAAQRYFAKPAKSLDLAEAALLAGLLKAPSRYAPTGDLGLARARAAVVLTLMAEQGVISEEQAMAARTRPARLAAEQLAGWLVDWVLEELTQELGKPAQDAVVRTTLEPRIQAAAEAAVARLLPKEKALQAAVVVLDTGGAVRAMVGGASYVRSPYNRAVHARRQPGSAFKPFVYLTALERGWAPGAAIEDAPVRVGDWRPANIDGRYHGRVSLTQALALSLNSAAVRLGQEVGVGRVAATARRLGIASPLREVASLPLGTSEVGVLELTAAYLPFANGGVRRPPYAVEAVEDSRGRELWRRARNEALVLTPERAGQMALMLRAVVAEGTGRAAALPDRRVAGKTGTSQDNRDAWFVGFSGEHVVGVWVGNDDGKPMADITGGGLPARIFAEVMRAAPAPALVAEARPEPRPPARQENGLELLLDWVQRTFGR